MAKPGVMLGTGSFCAGQEKTPPILPFTTLIESDQRPRVCRRDAPTPTNAFAADSGLLTIFSVRTGRGDDGGNLGGDLSRASPGLLLAVE